MSSTVENKTWLIWQLVDSAFPSGGFAHSGGLEAAWQHGEIGGGEELSSYVLSNLTQIACGMLPFVSAAYNRPESMPELDKMCDAFLSNHVANRASRLQGRAFLSSVIRIFGPVTALETDLIYCHLAPIFGTITQTLEFGRTTAAELFLFHSFRGLIAAAVRLGIAGPMEGQSLQHRLTPRVREILLLTADRSVGDVSSVAPLLEIWQGSQDRLYSRLFQT